uniref:DUF177 domain-containing protein n=1 Tax=Globodera pallida TaxID=36090 RepID=A0A183CCG2_GLOPA
MQRAIKYFLQLYGIDTVDELYAFFKEEIKSAPGEYFPNPLCSADCCVHIVSLDHPNQRVIINGTLDLVGDLELFSTCYPKTAVTGIDWSEPLYVELKDLMICPGDLPQCLCAQQNLRQQDHLSLTVDELDKEEDDEGNADIEIW